MSFWKELSRRNVVKVGIAYAVAAWLIIHPVDIVFPILHLPEWSITLVAAFLIICFPFVLIFSWVYEVTPKGLRKTKEVPVSKSTTHVTGRKLNYIIIGLLVVAVALLVFDNFYLDRRTTETKQTPAVSDVAKTQKTIAVLPFVDLSSNSDQGYFVDGLSEELLNTLAQIPDLGVIARTSSFSFKGSGKTIQEIAKVLGVENILEGSVRKAGNALRITAQLVRASDGLHLWSKTYDKEFKVEKDSEEYHSITSLLRSEVTRINKIITQFLSYAKPLSLQIKKINAKAFFDDIYRLFSDQAKIKGVELIVLSDQSFDMKIDPELIKQSMMNLVQNAIDAVEKKGKVEINYFRKGNDV